MALDHIYPDWDAWAKFVTDYAEAGMAQDALESTHPFVCILLGVTGLLYSICLNLTCNPPL